MYHHFFYCMEQPILLDWVLSKIPKLYSLPLPLYVILQSKKFYNSGRSTTPATAETTESNDGDNDYSMNMDEYSYDDDNKSLPDRSSIL